MSTARDLEDDFVSRGKQEDKSIEVDVSYQIIRQVSSQLYTNPRKAVEELVCNSYDAGASECHINTPESESDYLAVLDDGSSMDMGGFEWLWSVAKSPKANQEDEDRVKHGRQQIGKFGVGKLAAFALGRKLTHIAAKNGTVRIVSVSEEEIKERDDGNPPSFNVHKMGLNEAQDVVAGYFEEKNLPNPWEKDWDSWTLAIVDDIEEQYTGKALQPQYLHQMIRTSIPLSAQFQVSLDNSKISRREPDTDERFTADLLEEDVRGEIENRLQSFWKERDEHDNMDDVPESKYECSVGETSQYDNVKEDVRALEVPELGPITGKATYYEDLLTKGKRKKRGLKDHGFRITVKGKLVNREDPLFGLDNPPHGDFGRFLAEIEVPDLDDAILVQRNQVSEEHIETHLVREVIQALFNYCRRKANRLDQQKLEEIEEDEQSVRTFGTRLNTLAPFDATQGLRGLSSDGFPEGGLGSIDVKFSSYDESDEITYYSSDDQTIFINESHPLFKALEESNKMSNEFKQVFGEAVAGNLLASGYLEYHGVEQELLDISKEVSDDALRSAAGYIRDEIEYYINEIHDASLEGGSRYEEVIVDVFRQINVSARHEGASDRPDGVLTIPQAGSKNLRFCMEAKGSKGIVNHEDAKEATVTRHKEEAECDHAVVIAREFQLDGKYGKDSALLREMDGSASLLTNEAMEKLLRLHKRRRFTHQQIVDILTNDQHPDELVDYVGEIWQETPEPGLMREILDIGWDAQTKNPVNKPAIGMVLGDENILERGIEKQKVANVIEAVAVSTGMVDYDRGEQEFELFQHPDVILEQMMKVPEEDAE
ncbi:Histidine kinase-, DNA gyrase B-, and HSP90-like ATPase [Halogranum rubrum]|uniref:Histidine kinase-, DNA gyrase B-, and HSP90-like ATPase n=1 Tax=Halogranum rubrum TaxID=553466 RepID=A0A1I4JL02_9EURY|nr:ATP-binding protein [Halogranum rubrum]SFL67230.1 Histidine kinase-, DNA gyrase B-, and HSP90-like ATPase [Halogranum rubrum]